jgi:aryl-alcohol dehydrogenase-like predicted oxidoreductase
MLAEYMASRQEHTMHTRKLGNTDLELTTIGLGTWAMGGPWQFGWGPQEDGEALAAITTAIERGINWIDTAPIYGLGHSEELIGRVLRGLRKKPLIATKCGLRWNDKRERVPCLDTESIRRECDESLQRMGIDVIDLYQMHWPDPEPKIEKAWEEMVRLKERGLVRHIGVCNYNIAQLERIARIHPVASLQPPYSMLHREVERELLDYCASTGLGVIVYSPMQRGLLTGKFDKARLAALAPDDHRRRHPDFQEPQVSATLAMVEKLKPIADRYGRNRAELAIAWILRRPEVTAAIVGARRPDQVEGTARAGDFSLSREDIAEIETLLTERERRVTRSL